MLFSGTTAATTGSCRVMMKSCGTPMAGRKINEHGHFGSATHITTGYKVASIHVLAKRMSFIVPVDTNVGVAMDWLVINIFIANSYWWVQIGRFFLYLRKYAVVVAVVVAVVLVIAIVSRCRRHPPQPLEDSFRQFRGIFLLYAIAFSICNELAGRMSSVLKTATVIVVGRRREGLTEVNPGPAFFG